MKRLQIVFLVVSSILISHNAFAIDGGSCMDLQYGIRVRTEGGRPGMVIDCRVQDNVIDTESYATVKFNDDPEHPKEIHWSHLRLDS